MRAVVVHRVVVVGVALDWLPQHDMCAVLIAGLVSAGMDRTIAVPAVFLYRASTFWLPILLGWSAFSYLRREDFV